MKDSVDECKKYWNGKMRGENQRRREREGAEV
jgi:hypothetical protein